MFRITRGHHVQHINIPFPMIRDLDADDEDVTREDATPADAPAPVASLQVTTEAEASADAPQ